MIHWLLSQHGLTASCHSSISVVVAHRVARVFHLSSLTAIRTVWMNLDETFLSTLDANRHQQSPCSTAVTIWHRFVSCFDMLTDDLMPTVFGRHVAAVMVFRSGLQGFPFSRLGTCSPVVVVATFAERFCYAADCRDAKKKARFSIGSCSLELSQGSDVIDTSFPACSTTLGNKGVKASEALWFR